MEGQSGSGGAGGNRAGPGAKTPKQAEVAPSRLPQTSGNLLLGRKDELKLLDDAWENPSTRILSLVAWGGTGKTALVKHWLGRMSATGWRGAERVFDWTFYSQGTSDKGASADLFIDAALRWFGDEDPTLGSPWDKGERLARLVASHRTLLVLDGLEPLQHPPGLEEGKLKDPALETFLKGFAASGQGLCLLTTRERLADLAHLENTVAPRVVLDRLSPEAGADLLAKLGVKGSEQEILETVEETRGHALTLNLLGNYLRKAHGGEAARRVEARLWEADRKQGGHAHKVMEAYERWLGEGPELSILHLLGLFDRPADGAALRALRGVERPWWRFWKTPYEKLVAPLLGVGEADWNWAVSNLSECGLASPEPDGGVDAHPLVREHFGRRLEEGPEEARREAHRRLYEHYRGAAPERPESLEGLTPLYRAVWHGCHAGLHRRAMDEVWWGRILRGEEHFSWKKLGAFGPELGAAACFFGGSWDRPSAGLIPADRAFALAEAGFALRALGRLEEAAGPLRAAREAYEALEDWKNAARQAGNLSELAASRGDLSGARGLAERSVGLADRSGDAFMRLAMRTTLADALWQLGSWAEAAGLMEEAEGMQKGSQPEYPLLYSLQGHGYCDLLLGEAERAGWRAWLWAGGGPAGARGVAAACGDVGTRAKQTLEWAIKHLGLLANPLDRLTLGRVALLEALAAIGAGAGEPGAESLEEAESRLKEAVAGLRQAGQQEYLPRGLIAPACLRGVSGDPEGALEDLREAEEIASRGPMKLHQADVRLRRARLRLGWRLRGTVSDPELIALDDIRKDFAEAKRLIDECGYHRRDPEMSDLEAALVAAEEPLDEVGD